MRYVVHPTNIYVGAEWVGTPKQNGIMLLLQCPGRTEGVVGRPIVGQSGRLMREWMNKAGIENYYISNMCKYVPPAERNDPTEEELAACLSELEQEVEKWKPSVIIGCGKYATDWLGFKGSQTQRNGRVMWSEEKQAQCYAMFHPSYIMRKRGSRRAYAELVGGVLAMLSLAAGGRESAPKEEFKFIPKTPYTYRCLSESIDTETDSLDPRVATLNYSGHYNGGNTFVIDWRDYTGEKIRTHVGVAVMHHALYDMVVLGDRYTFDSPPHDTMIKLWEKDEDDLSLKGAAARIGLHGVSSKELGFGAENAAQDAVLTWRLHKALTLEPYQSHLYESIDRPLIPILARCTLAGMDTDAEGAQVLSEGIEAKLDVLRERIRQVSGVENPNSDEQVRQAFKEMHIQLLPKRTTKTKKQSVDKSVLEACEHPLAKLLLYWNDITLQRSRYLKPLLPGHIQFTYKIHGTETGRISSDGQNFPAPMRRLIRARPGKKFVIADYSGAELRVAAVMSGDENLLQMFKDGRSPHKELAVRLYGRDYTERQYVATKAANFEKLYGGGVKKLAEVTGMPLSVAMEIFAAHEQAYPVLNEWLDRQVQLAYSLGYSETMHGRRRKLPDLWSDHAVKRSHAERQAKNSPIQGTVGDMTKEAMDIYEETREDIIHQCHDEIITEVDEVDLEHSKDVLSYAMMKAAREVVKGIPMEIDLFVSDRWEKTK